MYISTKIECFNLKEKKSLPVFLIHKDNFDSWLSKQNDFTINFINNHKIKSTGDSLVIPNLEGQISKIICIIDEGIFSIANLPNLLNAGDYHIEYSDIKDLSLLYLGFGMGSYIFNRYKTKPKNVEVKLYLPKEYHSIIEELEATYIVRDMISTSAEDMGPEDISKVIYDMAKEFNADVSELVGEDLIKYGYMGVYSVGKASHRAPRLVTLKWGDANNPKISLIGKGVCFDSGGLDIKSSSGMLFMKKDMGGAAHAIALAYIIMKQNLPINLSLVIPTVENAIGPESFRPGDIISMKNGVSVEITNTDAEGRLIMAEPLAEESSTKPDLLINFSTLTGGARVAVGNEIACFFSNSDDIANSLYSSAKITQDEVWRLPLSDCYRKCLKSNIADISHCDLSPMASAIKAALFLEHFVGVNTDTRWLHFDIMAYNNTNQIGKPVGGEMMGLRATLEMIKKEFQIKCA